MFCSFIGFSVDLSLVNNKSLDLLFFAGFLLILALSIYFPLCRFFKIDRDTAIVASSAGIFSPAMIAPIVTMTNNKKILIPGIGVGLLGLALGTILGLFVHWIGSFI